MVRLRYIALSLACLIAVGAVALTAANRLPVAQGPASEAPELGRIGDYSVGTVERDFAFPNRATITPVSVITGTLPHAERHLKVRIWHPAQNIPSAPRATYGHSFQGPGQQPVEISMPGIAVPDALPLAAKRFPLVVMSHGFNGWNTQFSNLGETLASHGYIVASIDHGDVPITSKSSFLLSFANVLLGRVQDQRQVLTRLLADADALHIDTEKVALLGYSMGGYGALATAGASYDPASTTIGRLPAAARDAVTTTAPDLAAKIDALIVLAPLGGQPDSRVWTSESLSRVTAPTLVIDGDHDDVVNFGEGVSWIFDQMRGADRHMLVFRDARHNIVGNPVPSSAATAFPVIEFMNEPVWRQDRINMINQHFICAFLDLHLKGDKAKAAYLTVPTEDAGDGEWPMAFGESAGGTLAGNAQPKYWRGSQRRWALGLEMHGAARGVSGKIASTAK
jgi:predicted dienelactone hydrolase